MTDESMPPYPVSLTENVISFLANTRASASIAPLDIEEAKPDRMPSVYSLSVDGVYQLPPGEDDDLVPVRICSGQSGLHHDSEKCRASEVKLERCRLLESFW